MRSEFTIPFPPSVNSLFANSNRGRVKTKAYKAWIDEAGWMIQTQADRHNRHTGNVSFTLLARKPDNRVRDISNLLKAAEDLAVRQGILVDDSQIVRTSAEWTTDLHIGARIVIEDLLSPQSTELSTVKDST